MASNKQSPHVSTYVWLDSSANSDKPEPAEIQLKAQLENLKIYTTINECRNFISTHRNYKILLIASGSFGRELLPHIHDLPQLLGVYIYCFDQERNEEWSKKYSKVECVSTDVSILIQRILSKSTLLSTTDSPETDSFNQDILWFRLLIEVLIRMNDTTQAKADMLQYWRKEEAGDSRELSESIRFEKTFVPSQAINWYTAPCGICRFLAKVLYSKDYSAIYELRFIIKYLYLQLQEKHQQQLMTGQKNNLFTVYRGISMKSDDQKLVKTDIGSLYSDRGVFGSSLDRSVALHFALNNEENRIKIIFEAEIDTALISLPYAGVTDIAYFPMEKEVLFMFGTIFQVNKVSYDEKGQLWIIKLSLCGEDDPRLKDMVDYIKYEIKDTADLITLADLFVKMGEYELAKEFYTKYQVKLSSNDPNTKRASRGLSNVADIEGNYYISEKDYRRAHRCFKKELELCEDLPSQHPDFGKCYANIANLYDLEGNKQLALENYQKAFDIFNKTLPAFHPDTTKVAQAIGTLSPAADVQSNCKTDLYFYSENKTSHPPTISDTTATTAQITSDTNSNLETFQIVWIDANVNGTEDNVETYNELRKSVNYIKTFENLREGEEYIRVNERKSLILIVSGGFGREIVQRIHDLSQTSCIYVFCGDRKRNEEWSKDYRKVKAVITERQKLVEAVSQDQTTRNLTEDPVPMSILNRATVAKQTTAKDISKETGSILWFQLLIDVLRRMPHSTDAKAELIKYWRENYVGNSSELAIIKEFERKFQRDKSVWWYTLECSLYKILNKALREYSIDTIFAFRFFLTELSKQVTQLYEGYIDFRKTQEQPSTNQSHIIHVYRGQLIVREELEEMQGSIGGFISINSFFSTSRSKKKAVEFLLMSTPTDQLKRLLFRIKVDISLPTRPFADVEGLTAVPGEREVLFMLGSIFRIENVMHKDEDDFWVINLSLCSEDDFELKELFAYLKKDIGEETSMVTLGNVLVQMGEYDKAEKIYRRIDHREGLIGVTQQKGNYYLAVKQYKLAIQYYKETLKLSEEFLPASHPDIGKTFNSIAMSYEFWKKDNKAIEYYNYALGQYKRTMKDNHPLIIQTTNSLQKLQTRGS